METTLGADDSVDGWAVVLPSSTMRVVDGTFGMVVERVVSALSGFVVKEIPWVVSSDPVDDSILTVVYTRVVTGTAVVFVSVVGCVDVTTGNDVCDTGRAVLVDVDVSDDVPVTSSKVVVAVVVGWLVRPVVPSFGVLVVVDKGN